jgi:two-component system CitB family sensor kinase
VARLRRSALYVQILVLQVVIVVIALVAVGVGAFLHTRDTLHDQFGERALAVARAVAVLPEVRTALTSGEPGGELQELVARIRLDTGMSYIAVADRDGIRFTHPTPDRIGEPLSTDPSDALAGQTVVVTEKGTLGTSVRAKVPIYDQSGQIIGLVSVGVLVTEIGGLTARTFWTVLGYGLGALALGLLGSWAVAARLRRKTFGLAPDEIATLYEHREAMLLGVREGLVTVDDDGVITLINDEARRLLGVDGEVVGRPLVDVVEAGPLAETLRGLGVAEDVTVVSGARVLVLNRRPAEVRSRRVGAVITLRDRTELETLVRELANAHGMANALRAKAHEHSNRMHTIAGLIELGQYDEVTRFVTQETRLAQSLTEAITDDIGDPLLNAVLLAKAALASEHGLQLRVTRDEALVTSKLHDVHDVVTVLGNLVDNAIDAVLATGRPGTIDVALHAVGDALVIRVTDSGAGVPDDLAAHIFTYGFSTKSSTARRGRGIGLAIVSGIVNRQGGAIEVGSAGRDGGDTGGAVFTVTLPGVIGADQAHLVSR